MISPWVSLPTPLASIAGGEFNNFAQLSKEDPKKLQGYVDYFADFMGTPRLCHNVGLLKIASYLIKHCASPIDICYLDLFAEAVIGKEHMLCYPVYDYKDGIVIIRYGITWDKAIKRIIDYNPDVVGISCLYSFQHNDALNAARCVKEAGKLLVKDIPVVVGGVHPSFLDEYFAKKPEIDIVVRGEGEATFLEVVQKLSQSQSLDGVKGITYFKDKVLHKNEDRPFLHPKDIPVMKRDLLTRINGELALYVYGSWNQGPTNKRFDTIERSRGCYSSSKICRNCASGRLFGRHRSIPVEQVISEIEELIANGVEVISDEADQILLPTKKFLEYCQILIDKGISERVTFQTTNGMAIKLLKEMGEEGWELMVKAGYTDLTFAVDGSPEYVKRVLKKPNDVEFTKQILTGFRKISKKLNKPVILRVFVMLGGPGSKPEDLDGNYNFIKDLTESGLVDDTIPMIATPITGSEFFSDTMNLITASLKEGSAKEKLRVSLSEGAIDYLIQGFMTDGEEGIYRCFEEFRIWDKFRYSIPIFQELYGLDPNMVKKMAYDISKLSKFNFRIG